MLYRLVIAVLSSVELLYLKLDQLEGIFTIFVFSIGWCLLVRPEQSPPTFCTSSPGSRRFSGRPSAPQSQFDWFPGEGMRRFVYCKVVLTTSLVWVLVDVFLLLYFSECNKCDDKKDGSLLPALRGESTASALMWDCCTCLHLILPEKCKRQLEALKWHKAQIHYITCTLLSMCLNSLLSCFWG